MEEVGLESAMCLASAGGSLLAGMGTSARGVRLRSWLGMLIVLIAGLATSRFVLSLLPDSASWSWLASFSALWRMAPETGIVFMAGGSVLFFRVKPTLRALVDASKRLRESEERRLAEDALRSSESRLKAAQQLAHVGNWELDIDNNKITWSDENYRIYEKSPSATGLQFEDFLNAVHPDDRAMVCEIYARSVNDRTPYEVIHRLMMPDGRIKWVHALGQNVYDENGRHLRIFGTEQDITAHKQAEDELRRAQAKLEQVLDVSPAAIYVIKLDPAGIMPPHLSFMSQSISRIAAYDLQDWAQPGFWESHLHPDDRERVLAEQGSLYENGSLQHEYRFERPDGQFVWVHDRLVLVRDGIGRPVEIVGTWLDISERVRGEQDLQRLNRFYSVLSRANEAIVRIREAPRLFDEICRISVEEGGFAMAWIGLLNDASEEVIPVACRGHDDGYLDYLEQKGTLRYNGPTARAIQENCYSINQDTEHNPVMAPWRDAALQRGYRSSAAFPLTRGGKAVGALTLYAQDPHSFTDEINALFQDLVEDVSFALDFFDQEARRKLAEERLMSLNEALEARIQERTRLLENTNKELESFSYSVSHDLRAPLRSIDGFSEILEKRYGAVLDERAKGYLDRVRRASQRMGELIDDLLQLARVSRSELKKMPVDLSALVRTIAASLQETQPARQVSFKLEEGVIVEADLRLIRGALENLLGNAWKFTAHQAYPTIEFGTLDKAGERVLYIRDNGAGFDMQYANKLFGAFQRLHRADEFEGTGIGLATVQRIVHRHNGRVWAEGEIGKGAIFYFTL